MPYGVKKVDGYQVKNKETGKVHAKGTSKAKAEAQVRLLQGVEHGMRPRTTRETAGLDKETKARPKTHKGHKQASRHRATKSRR